MVMLVAFGSLLGFRFHTGPLSVLAAFGLAYVFYLAVCWVSALVGLIAPTPETVQGLAFIWTMPLTFGSSVLLANTKTMPGWLQASVKVNPVTHLADSVRALTVGGPIGNHAWYTLAWAAGIVLASFPVAVWLYGRKV
jgi:oleandomycin transport system permease protein